jgi:hypothetical protein
MAVLDYLVRGSWGSAIKKRLIKIAEPDVYADAVASDPNYPVYSAAKVVKKSVNIGGNQAYVTGKVMGGVKELVDIAREDNGSGWMTSVIVGMKLNNAAPIDVFMFSKLPVGSYADNATFAIDPADLPYCSKVYSVGQWFPGGASASVGQASSEPRFFVCEDATNKKSMWVIAVARGSITLTAAADAVLSIRAVQN